MNENILNVKIAFLALTNDLCSVLEVSEMADCAVVSKYQHRLFNT